MRLNANEDKVKFNGTNYQDWSTATMFYLIEKNLWHVVEEDHFVILENETEESPSYLKRIKSYKEADTQARGRIGGTIETSFQEQVRTCKTASEMWKKLRNLFEVTSAAASINALSTLIKEKWSNGQNVVAHLGRMEQLFRLAHGKESNNRENELIPLVMLSMGDEWSPYFTTFRGSSEIMASYGKFKAELIVGAVARENHVDNTKVVENRSSNIAQRGRGKSTFQGKCYNRNRFGHMAIHCKSKKKESNLAQSKQDNKVKENHSAFMAISTEITNKRNEWWLDSGCTDIMCNNKSMICNETDAPPWTVVRIANKETLKVESKGQLNIGSNLDGMEVLYVPDICKNLISVAVLDNEGYSTIISKGKAIIKDKKGNEIMHGELDEKENLYRLDVKESIAYTASREIDWHSRLGHANSESLKKLGIMVTKEICKACNLAKAKRETFKKKNVRSNKPL